MKHLKTVAIYIGVAALGVVIEKKTGIFSSTLGKLPGVGALFG